MKDVTIRYMTTQMPADRLLMVMAVCVAALAAPFVGWAIEQLVPYPVIVEEIIKAALAFALIHYSHQTAGKKAAVGVGVCFGLSETILYAVSGLTLGLAPNAERILYTVPMHVLTFYIQYLGFLYRRPLVGFALATLLHFLFNRFV